MLLLHWLLLMFCSCFRCCYSDACGQLLKVQDVAVLQQGVPEGALDPGPQEPVQETCQEV